MTATIAIDTVRKQSSPLELRMWDLIQCHGFPPPLCAFTGDGRQHRFHPVRQWRLDFAWPDSDHLIALECQGGLWRARGHGMGAKFRVDREKSAAAQMLGWLYLEVTVDMIRDGLALELLRQAFITRTGIDYMDAWQ